MKTQFLLPSKHKTHAAYRISVCNADRETSAPNVWLAIIALVRLIAQDLQSRLPPGWNVLAGVKQVLPFVLLKMAHAPLHQLSRRTTLSHRRGCASVLQNGATQDESATLPQVSMTTIKLKPPFPTSRYKLLYCLLCTQGAVGSCASIAGLCI